MPGIAGADDPHDAVALDDLAEFASALDRGSDFHGSNSLFYYMETKLSVPFLQERIILGRWPLGPAASPLF